jgi:hypothetical protein
VESTMSVNTIAKVTRGPPAQPRRVCCSVGKPDLACGFTVTTPAGCPGAGMISAADSNR